MENVVYPNNNFIFDNITLGQPSVIQGGSYETKILNNLKPIYLQTPSCFTKQGITISGKKAYCDLMYTNEDIDILTWFEKLVDKLQELIFDKRKLWFHNEMDAEDIDSAFTQPMRTYKGGKFYLVRTSIQGSHTNNPLQGFSCYDENQNKVDPEVLKENNNRIIPLIEIKSIRFSSKSFLIDISLKQTMVMEDVPALDTCLINVNNNAHTVSDTTNEEEIHLEINDSQNANLIVGVDNDKEIVNDTHNDKEIVNDTHNDNDNDNDNDHDVSVPILSLGLEEVDIDTSDIEVMDKENIINISPQKDVYIELWEEARRKAKQSRKAAIEAHLQAKQIKTEHMLDNLDEDSEDEFFDEYVESLENLELEV